jgi:hypothetical protein
MISTIVESNITFKCICLPLTVIIVGRAHGVMTVQVFAVLSLHSFSSNTCVCSGA